MYPILEDEISLKTEITWAVSFLIWGWNAFLMRNEYKSLGYTTSYLRGAWISFLLCQTVVLIMEETGEAADEFEKVVIIFYINEAAMLLLVIAGFVFSDDFAPEKVGPGYSNFADTNQIEDSDYNKLNESIGTRRSRSFGDSRADRFKPEASQLEGAYEKGKKRSSFTEQRSKKGSFAHREERKSNENTLLSSLNVPTTLRVDVAAIESIEITGSEEIIRFDKKTIVYTIEYYIRGQHCWTRRSYSEFAYLVSEINKVKGDLSVPEIPGKTALKNDEATINERKEAFNRLLQFYLQHKVGFSYLAEFLLTPQNLPYYGKSSKRDASRISVPNNSVLTNKSDALKGNSVLNQESVHGEGFRELSEEEKNSVQDIANRKYQVESSGLVQGKDGTTFYKFKVRELLTGIEHVIVKRYKDFKALNEELKEKIAKQDRAIIPELPNKGKYSLATRGDPRVIEYRRNALERYLQKVLNNPVLGQIAYVQEFIRKKP